MFQPRFHIQNVARVWLAATLALFPLRVSAETEVPGRAFVPTGKWHLDGDQGRCVLRRDFIGETHPLSLSIEVLPLKDNLEVAIKTDSQRGAYAIANRKIGFGDDKSAIPVLVQSFETVDGRSHVDRFDISKQDFGRALPGQVTVLNFKPVSIQLSLPDIAAAMKYLDDCERALVESLDLPVEEIRATAQSVKAPAILRRLPPEYFEEAEKGDLEDVVIFRYMVGADGIATECGVLHRAASASLNAQACSPWAPLKATPAVNKDGKKVRGLSIERVRWTRKEAFSR
jgi:hypothetical protein